MPNLWGLACFVACMLMAFFGTIEVVVWMNRSDHNQLLLNHQPILIPFLEGWGLTAACAALPIYLTTLNLLAWWGTVGIVVASAFVWLVIGMFAALSSEDNYPD